MNEGDLDLPRGRHCYEEDLSKMREPPPKWGSIGNYVYSAHFRTFLANIHLPLISCDPVLGH